MNKDNGVEIATCWALTIFGSVALTAAVVAGLVSCFR